MLNLFKKNGTNDRTRLFFLVILLPLIFTTTIILISAEDVSAKVQSIIKLDSGQTEDGFCVQNSAGVNLFCVGSTGTLIGTGQIDFEVDGALRSKITSTYANYTVPLNITDNDITNADLTSTTNIFPTNVANGIAGLDATGRVAKANQHSATVYTDQANTFGGFLQSFGGNLEFEIRNPADTFSYLFQTSGISADRIVFLPLITEEGTFVITNFANTFGGGDKQTFQHSSTNAGMRLIQLSSNPSSLFNGDIWMNTDDGLKFQHASNTRIVTSTDATQTLTNKDLSSPTISGTADVSGIISFSGVGAGLDLNDRDVTATPVGTTDFFNFIIDVSATDDTGVSSVIRFDGRQTGAELVTRPIFAVHNFGSVAKFQINANGDTDLNSNSLIDVADIATGTISDETNTVDSIIITDTTGALDFTSKAISGFDLDCDEATSSCINVDTTDFIGVAEPKHAILTAGGATLQLTSTPTRQTIDGTNFDYIVLEYADAVDTSAIWNWEVPDNFDSTANIEVEIRYINTVSTLEIRWDGEFRGVADAGTWDGAFEGTAQVVDDTATASGIINTATMTFTSANHALNAGELAIFHLERTGTNVADDNTGIGRVIDVKIEWS